MENITLKIKDKVYNQMTKKTPNGFSLLELMVVIAIIGVMSAISIPMLINPEHKVSKAARELMGDMQRAKTRAIKENQDISIVFDTAGNGYRICSDWGGDGDWSTIDFGQTVLKTVLFTNYGAGVQYGSGVATTTMTGGAFDDGVTYTSNVLTFNSRGTCSLGYVYIFYGDASYAIGTLSTGNVRLRRWSGGAWR